MRSYVCIDCGVTEVTTARRGFLPQRCVTCRKEVHQSKSRLYYQKKRKKSEVFV